MSTAELSDLKAKLRTSVLELQSQISRDQNRLDDRLDRTTINAAQVSELQTRVDRAHNVHTALVAASAAQTDIDDAQTILTEAENELAAYNASPSVINDVDAHFTQIAIDEMEQSKTFRNTKISEIDTILAA